MNPNDFNLFANMLKKESGLVIGPDKAYLLESRLIPIIRKWNITTLSDLAARLRQERERDLLQDVIEAMTTNETSFFRDLKPFEQFRQHTLPMFLKAREREKRLRIWSCACSSGQEPYSLAMILDEERHRMPGWQVEIHASDISVEMLDRARSGVYSQFEAQRGLPITNLVKYFKQSGNKWTIVPAIFQMVRFFQFNLLDNMARLGTYDIVFCRNVMIYFDQ
ncbi:MAG: CheR family methyltransferase, partial [Pseudomonadota bacterium]|nr:CheR family methyltransferase [Pseudomonadota bacterium]